MEIDGECVGAALSVGSGSFCVKTEGPCKHCAAKERLGQMPSPLFLFGSRLPETDGKASKKRRGANRLTVMERNRLKMMKKRKSIAELIDGIIGKNDAPSEIVSEAGVPDSVGFAQASPFERLGEAFLARLNLPDGMDESEAVERILEMWNDADAFRVSGRDGAVHSETAESEALDDETDFDSSIRKSGDEAHAPRLPSPIRGGLFEAPKADYESMSAEQFRRLKKQLERASMDGRKIRL